MPEDQVMVVPMEVGGLTVEVETVVRAGPGQYGSRQTSSRIEKAQAAVGDAFNRAQDTIVAVANSTVRTMGRLGEEAIRPEKLEVKFGLKFAAEGGVIIAGASGEASLEVTLTYENHRRDRGRLDG